MLGLFRIDKVNLFSFFSLFALNDVEICFLFFRRSRFLIASRFMPQVNNIATKVTTCCGKICFEGKAYI